MKVLMLSKACIVGIYQRKLEELARQPGVELTVVVPPYWREGRRRIPLERLFTAGYTLRVEPMLLNGHYHLHVYPTLGRIIAGLRPDIIHIDEEPYNLATFHALWLGRAAGARCLFFTWQNILRWRAHPLERYVLTHADYAIAGNREAVGVLRGKGYRGPVAVIPQFGIDETLFAPRPLGQGTPFTIGFVARLVEEKGGHVLLQALAGLPGDWRLIIMGDGPQRAALEDLAARLAIASRVDFVQPVPSHQVPDWMRRFDCLVLPSLTRPRWKEQFGRVLVEAMACAVPVVGSDCGEIPHVIGDAGLIFPEGDAQRLRECIQRLLADPSLRQSLGQRGRERVLAHYTHGQIAAQTYTVYQEMIT